MARVLYAVATVTKAGEEEVRLYVKQPFAREVARLSGKTVLVLILEPETEAERVLSEYLKRVRFETD